jgi:hypothetical protein
MYRIDNDSAVGSQPAIPVAGTPGYFDAGDPSVGREATDLDAWWCNMVQEELMALLTAAGITPDKADQGQVLEAIQALISGSALTAGKRSVPVPVDYIQPRETGGCGAVEVLETTTNKCNIRYREFDDLVQQYAQFGYTFPASWNGGTIEFRAQWSHAAATSFGVAWSLAGVSIANDEALDSAFGTAVIVTDTGGTTDKSYWTAWSDPVTISGAAAGERQIFEFSRVVGDAGDDLDVAARLQDIEIRITLNAGDDS